MTATRYSLSASQLRRKIETTTAELREVLKTGGVLPRVEARLRSLLQRLEQAAR